ncbi:ATP-binding protein [Geobacter sp. FeAm09]|uniref:ATP-binding protein n=1 Tax=Geobacter sp. FeAm09 TaxID=2597769 RepID=UPI00197AA89C|nr:ATP-binding protein [Geobacter sp. FeAm09]
MVLAAAELRRSYRYAEISQRRRLTLAEAITAANLRFIESGSVSQMASILLDASMAVTNSPFGMLYELLPNGSASVQALSLASFDPVSDVRCFRDIQYEIRRHGSYEMKRHPSIFFAAAEGGLSVVMDSPAHPRWIPCACPICSPLLSRFMGIPLKMGTTVVGMLCLANKDSDYLAEDVAELEHYAQTCAMAVGIAKAELGRKAAMEQARQAQKMEAIGQLAGGIAHDFNNLLTVINGYSTLLLQKLDPDSAMSREAGQILNAGERATTLIRQLLTFSRRQIIAPHQIHVNSFITGLQEILCRLIGENIALDTKLSSDVGLIKADPGQIEQIVMNLVINARDAIERGGAITIETAGCGSDDTFLRRQGDSAPEDFIVISVADNGMGIADEIVGRIFEPFFTTKEQGSGTGLGLATVYGIVKQSGGHIQVLTEIGMGSEFRVYLPKCHDHAQAHPPLAAPVAHRAAQGTTGLILVVEDEPSVLELSAATLTSCGFEVLTAATPREALHLFELHGHRIDLLLSDVVMPGMTGPEMAKIMRDSHPELKVVFMSGYSEMQRSVPVSPAERPSFIMKPYNPLELTQIVTEHIRPTPWSETNGDLS